MGRLLKGALVPHSANARGHTLLRFSMLSVIPLERGHGQSDF